MSEPVTDAAGPSSCRSCKAPLRGTYCAVCGQCHRHGRLELRDLVATAWARIRRLDTPTLRTLGDLGVDPGQVGRDYLDGRRNPYVHPFVFALSTFALATAANLVWIDLRGAPEPLALPWLEVGLPTIRAALPVIQFVALPWFTLVLHGLFTGRARALTWVEDYVLVLFALGQVALLQGLMIPWVSQSSVFGLLVHVGLPIAWVSWIVVGVCRTPAWSTVVRVALAFALGLLAPILVFGG